MSRRHKYESNDEDTQFLRHPVRASIYQGRKHGVNATIAAIMGLITGTVIPMISQHWDQQNESEFRKSIYSRLNQDEKEIAVLQAQYGFRPTNDSAWFGVAQ